MEKIASEPGQRIKSKHPNFEKWLVKVVASVIAILVVLFFLIVTRNMFVVLSEVESIKNGPYPVSVAAGHIETLLVQLRTLTFRPIHLNTGENAQKLRVELDTINEDMLSQIKLIQDNSTADHAAITSIATSYSEMMRRQDVLVGMCADSSIGDSAVESYVANQINPLIEGLLVLEDNILQDSTNSVNYMYTLVHNAVQTTIVLSFVLMGFLVVAVFIYFYVLNLKTRREKILMENLEKALITAQNANEAKSAFLANMSHDIRTPMNAILGLTSIAFANHDNPVRVRECLNHIIVSSQQLLGLINDILDMSAIESGKIVFNNESFSLPNLVNEIVTVIHPQIQAKHQHLSVSISNIEHEFFIGDSTRIHQIIMNLISNAVKFTPEEGSISLSLSEVGSGHPGYSLYRIIIKDTGIGMKQEFLKDIFKTFERERNETTNFIEGTGLGMAITKNIVDLMGGTIEVESVPQKGSMFTVTIPLPYDSEAAEPDELLQELNGCRGLLVDSNEGNQTNVKYALWAANARFVSAPSIQKALETVRASIDSDEKLDFVILDESLSIEDIGRFMREFSQLYLDSKSVDDDVEYKVPLVFYATFDSPDTTNAAHEAGISLFVPKPYFKTNIYRAIGNAMMARNGGTQETCNEEESLPLDGRVLVVEDNEINREIITELIESFGPQVEIAEDGLAALEKIQEVEPGYYGLIFMDWQMPRMNGIEATTSIIAYERQKGIPHTPIVAMTANAFNENRKIALESGMDDFMTKPINLTELKEMLKKFFQNND